MGIDVLNHLNGMFGLAIWDEKNNDLLLLEIEWASKLFITRLKMVYSILVQRSEQFSPV